MENRRGYSCHFISLRIKIGGMGCHYWRKHCYILCSSCKYISGRSHHKKGRLANRTFTIKRDPKGWDKVAYRRNHYFFAEQDKSFIAQLLFGDKGYRTLLCCPDHIRDTISYPSSNIYGALSQSNLCKRRRVSKIDCLDLSAHIVLGNHYRSNLCFRSKIPYLVACWKGIFFSNTALNYTPSWDNLSIFVDKHILFGANT